MLSLLFSYAVRREEKFTRNKLGVTNEGAKTSGFFPVN